MKTFSQNPITKRFVIVINFLLSNQNVKNKSIFCKKIDYLPQSLNFILNGERDIPIEPLSKMFKEFSFINSEWLLTGVGTMLKAGSTISNSNVINGSINKSNIQNNTINSQEKNQPQEKQLAGSVFSCSSCPFVSSLQANINDLRYTIKMQQNLINNQKK